MRTPVLPRFFSLLAQTFTNGRVWFSVCWSVSFAAYHSLSMGFLSPFPHPPSKLREIVFFFPSTSHAEDLLQQEEPCWGLLEVHHHEKGKRCMDFPFLPLVHAPHHMSQLQSWHGFLLCKRGGGPSRNDSCINLVVREYRRSNLEPDQLIRSLHEVISLLQ